MTPRIKRKSSEVLAAAKKVGLNWLAYDSNIIYVKTYEKSKFQCIKEGHIVEPTLGSVLGQHGCGRCFGYGKTIEDCRSRAAKERGECLSEEYNGGNPLLLWKCKAGHEWEARAYKVLNGDWCPRCYGFGKTIADMQNIAESRGGKCHSLIYVNGTTKLEWGCSLGHTWLAMPETILQGTWCPHCNNYIYEKICRLIFESAYGEKFPTAYLKDIDNKSGKPYQIDGLCEKLNIGFEYNGKQHYRLVKKFHKTEQDLQDQENRDRKKRELAHKYNIKLIEIPYFTNKIKDLEGIYNYIRQCHPELPEIADIEKLNISSVYLCREEPKQEILEIIKENKAELLSEYIGDKIKIEIKCKYKHVFEIEPSILKYRRKNQREFCLCSVCSRDRQRKSMIKHHTENVRTRLDTMNMDLLSECRDSRDRITIKCRKCCHEWTPIALEILYQRTGCPKCAGNLKYTDEDIKDYLKPLGVELLSKYENNHAKLKLKCLNKHIFYRSFHSIRIAKKPICPEC